MLQLHDLTIWCQGGLRHGAGSREEADPVRTDGFPDLRISGSWKFNLFEPFLISNAIRFLDGRNIPFLVRPLLGVDGFVDSRRASARVPAMTRIPNFMTNVRIQCSSSCRTAMIHCIFKLNK